MSEIYDNWDRLVQATLRREDDKLSAQRTPSAVSLASSSSFFERSSFEGSFNFQHIKADTDNSESVKEQEAIELFPGGQNGDKQIKPAVKKFNAKNKIREAPFWNLGRLGGKNRYKDGIELYPEVFSNFNFNELKASTNNFSPENKISGVGNVYKGILRDGTEVAIKKFSGKTKRGCRELVYRLNITYPLVHPYIARPMGCCLAENQLLLVYKYMGNISIEHALHEEFESMLNWKTRFRICFELAKGLAFLHESMLEIIHCNIKPSNILLDKDFTVKISEFEYSNKQPTKRKTAAGILSGGRISQYMAPEYVLGHSLTPKVDVYSFGIILLEIVSGQTVCTFKRNETVYLLDMAYQNQIQGTLIALVDPRLGSDYSYREALTILQLAMQCVSPSPSLRPTMHEVVKILEGKKETQISSISTFHWVEDPIMTGLSQSGGTSLEDDSDTSTSYSTSEEIDDCHLY